MQTHGMLRWAQELQESLSSCHLDQLQDWDAGEALARSTGREFRLSQKDHSENNGDLLWLQRWAEHEADHPDRSQMLWVGGHSGSKSFRCCRLSK